MLSRSSPEQMELSATEKKSQNAGKLASRKIWLPKLLYDCLPLFYLISGIGALLATLYISHWLWILPHYLLFSAACLHLAFFVYRRRRKSRGNQSSLTDVGQEST